MLYLLFVLRFFEFFARGQADFLDAAVGGTGDGALKLAPGEAVAYLRQAAELFLHQAADGHSVDLFLVLDGAASFASEVSVFSSATSSTLALPETSQLPSV